MTNNIMPDHLNSISETKPEGIMPERFNSVSVPNTEQVPRWTISQNPSQLIPCSCSVNDTIQKIYRLINFHFDPFKADLWMNVANPLLGDKTPIQMIEEGRAEKLLKFIDNSLDENNP